MYQNSDQPACVILDLDETLLASQVKIKKDKNGRVILKEDGTPATYRDYRVLAGTVELLQYLHASGIPFHFFSAGSKNRNQDYIRLLLEKAGIPQASHAQHLIFSQPDLTDGLKVIESISSKIGSKPAIIVDNTPHSVVPRENDFIINPGQPCDINNDLVPGHRERLFYVINKIDEILKALGLGQSISDLNKANLKSEPYQRRDFLSAAESGLNLFNLAFTSRSSSPGFGMDGMHPTTPREERGIFGAISNFIRFFAPDGNDSGDTAPPTHSRPRPRG